MWDYPQYSADWLGDNEGNDLCHRYVDRHYKGGLLENQVWFHLCCSTDGCMPLFVFLHLRGPLISDLPIGDVFSKLFRCKVSCFIRAAN